MPTVNLQQLKNQALYLQTNEDLSEQEAITRAIENANIDQEFATEINLEAEISRLMNTTSEQQREEAEKQLEQQTQDSGNPSVITLNTAEPTPAEADSSMQGMDSVDPTADTMTQPAPTGEQPEA